MTRRTYPLVPTVSAAAQLRQPRQDRPVTCPILLGHGRRDTSSRSMSQDARRRGHQAPVTLFVVDDADHNDFYDVGEDQVFRGAGDFLESCRPDGQTLGYEDHAKGGSAPQRAGRIAEDPSRQSPQLPEDPQAISFRRPGRASSGDVARGRHAARDAASGRRSGRSGRRDPRRPPASRWGWQGRTGSADRAGRHSGARPVPPLRALEAAGRPARTCPRHARRAARRLGRRDERAEPPDVGQTDPAGLEMAGVVERRAWPSRTHCRRAETRP